MLSKRAQLYPEDPMVRFLTALCAASLLAAPAARAQDTDAGQTADAGQAADVPANEKHNLDTSKPELKGKDFELKVKGKKAKAYVATPTGQPKGALLVLHEYWGLNDWVKHQSDQLADAGYLALAIDLYKGKVTTDPKEAAALMGQLDEKWGDQVEEAGTEWLKKQAKGRKVGTIGWCMGGGQALRAALHDPKDISAIVMYYGLPVTDVKELRKLKGKPLLGIWANKDGWITPDKVAAFDKALTEAGVPHEFHAYDADHAFANPSNGPKYSSEAAKDAWDKTLAFLEKNLASKK
jgi:carboxymethylenebutenolidase